MGKCKCGKGEVSSGPFEGFDHHGYTVCNATIGKLDQVNNPPHYTAHPSGIECIQVTEHMGFNLGNAIKYIWRADLKEDTDKDLRKAMWYISRELERRNKPKEK